MFDIKTWTWPVVQGWSRTSNCTVISTFSQQRYDLMTRTWTEWVVVALADMENAA